jgi:branched-chain amino acid transport system substrate-binding protein
MKTRFLTPYARLGLALLVASTLILCQVMPRRAAVHVLAQAATRPITIGALLSLTEGEATLGKNSQAAVNLAAQDINAELSAAGSPQSVSIVIEDTQFDTANALSKAQALAAQGVQVAIGPQSSAEAAAIKPWADANSFLLLSHGSTASSLSLPGDNLLRFVPDDTYEMQAISTLLQHDGIKAVVPLWRDDPGNGGLHDSLVREFPALGGVVLSGASYAPGAQDYSAQVATVSAQVQQAQQEYGAKAVAVVLASFDEAVQVFHTAQNDPILSSVSWYGTDGIAQSAAIINDPQAAAFAEKIGFPCANLGLDPAARSIWQPLSDRIKAVTGARPDASALAAYDATWVAALAYLETGPAPDISALRQTIMAVAGRYYGATGRTLLNAAGDRDGGDYDFWSVRNQGGSPGWVVTDSYEATPGQPGQIVAPTP